jgi:hypothetical protein
VRTTKAKSAAGSGVPQPVWCHHCSIRIAPYDMRKIHHGKDYHRDCYNKLNLDKSRKN